MRSRFVLPTPHNSQDRRMLSFSSWLSYLLALIGFTRKTERQEVVKWNHGSRSYLPTRRVWFDLHGHDYFLEGATVKVLLQGYHTAKQHRAPPPLFSTWFFRFPRFLLQASVELRVRASGGYFTFILFFLVQRNMKKLEHERESRFCIAVVFYPFPSYCNRWRTTHFWKVTVTKDEIQMHTLGGAHSPQVNELHASKRIP